MIGEPSLDPDIAVARQAIRRLVDSLSSDPTERAQIAASAAFQYITLDQDIFTAERAFQEALRR